MIIAQRTINVKRKKKDKKLFQVTSRSWYGRAAATSESVRHAAAAANWSSWRTTSQWATCPASFRTMCYHRCRRIWTWCSRRRLCGYRGDNTSCWDRRRRRRRCRRLCRLRCRTLRPPAVTPCPSAPANNTTVVRNAFSVSARDGPDAETDGTSGTRSLARRAASQRLRMRNTMTDIFAKREFRTVAGLHEMRRGSLRWTASRKRDFLERSCASFLKSSADILVTRARVCSLKTDFLKVQSTVAPLCDSFH